MRKVVEVSADRPAQVTAWTVVSDVMKIYVPQTIERHQDIGTGNFYLMTRKFRVEEGESTSALTFYGR